MLARRQVHNLPRICCVYRQTGVYCEPFNCKACVLAAEKYFAWPLLYGPSPQCCIYGRLGGFHAGVSCKL